MYRRLIPFAIAVTLLGACSPSTSNAPEPGAPSTSRGEDGRDGRAQGRAEQGRGGGRAMGQREDMILRGITLSADQQQRIQAIRASHRTQMQQLREQGGSDRAAIRDRVQALMEKQQVEVRAVLTAEQQAQYDRNITEMRERQQRGGRRPGRDARA